MPASIGQLPVCRDSSQDRATEGLFKIVNGTVKYVPIINFTDRARLGVIKDVDLLSLAQAEKLFEQGETNPRRETTVRGSSVHQQTPGHPFVAGGLNENRLTTEHNSVPHPSRQEVEESNESGNPDIRDARQTSLDRDRQSPELIDELLETSHSF
jgi:hypothetical protein